MFFSVILVTNEDERGEKFKINMKNKSILYLTVLLSLFIACSNSQKQTIEYRIPTDELNSIEKDTFPLGLGNSINNLVGVWIRKDYIENLKNSLSPASSYRFIENISVLIIDSSSINTLKIGVIYNNHEGGELGIDFLNNELYLTYNTEGGGKEKSIITVDSLSLKVQVENVYYEFYKFSLNYRDNPIKYVTDSILFNNKVFNSVYPSTGIKMILSKDGRSYNFDKYEKFEVETDFMVYEEYNDIIRFYENNGKSKAFKYYFNNNILEFRGFGKESDSILYKFGIVNLP
jgi:hypothetical protein